MASAGQPVERTLEVRNEYGLHARPAALLVKTASQYAAEIKVEHKGMMVSAKSIMGLLTIEGHHGAHLRIIAEGADAQEAVEALEELFRQNFHE